jgi:hypothetical protein
MCPVPNCPNVVIRTVKYADDLVVLQAKEETVLQGMIDRVIEIDRCCGMGRNGGGDWANENLKAPVPNTDYGR